MEKKQWIIIGIIVAVLVSLLGYGIYSKLEINSERSAAILNVIKNILKIGLIVIIVFVAYKLYLIFTGKSVGQMIKTAIPDEQYELIKERMIFKENVKGFYDKNHNLQFAPNTVIEGDFRPFVSKGSGEEFMTKELFFINSSNSPIVGARTLVIPLNREAKYVAGGLFAKHDRTTLFGWLKHKSFLKKLAFTTPQKESLRLAMLDQDGELNLEQYHRIDDQERAKRYQAQQKTIVPEYDDLGDQE